VLRVIPGPVQVTSDADWVAATTTAGPSARVRLIGGDRVAVASALSRRPDIAVHSHPVTESGRLELLPFLREQAVSITAHRFGTPHRLSDGLI
jgi:RHH-type proline utilization regulon transcriptional repressor/proline dehydrogenase/delta 1-pyrroline-5-carboxylate dehydrogenase